MHIDPFIDGFAELHDRHRDMRLDVDNMSYEVLHSNHITFERTFTLGERLY